MIARAPAQGVRRPRIAFLAAYLDDEYEWGVWKGVREAVEARGGSAVYFAGAGLEDPLPERRARTVVFDLVSKADFDGVLCLSSVVSHFVGIGATEEWLASRGLPLCCVGPAERFPNVCINDATGITQLVEHLIAQHRHRRIAFITGPTTNAESRRRLSAYERALSTHKIAYDPGLVLEGDFSTQSGARAVHQLFDSRQRSARDLDAVVASNDYMAFGAIEELTRRRIDVPEQIAVVGFDDIEPARIHAPSLTTVKQPLEELGRAGVTRLVELIAGGSASGSLELDTELVLRRSCGCLPTEVPLPLPGDTGDGPTLPTGASITLVQAALAAELDGSQGAFARVLEPLLREIAAEGGHRLDHARHFADELARRLRGAHADLVHERLSRLARVLHKKMFGPQAYLSTALAELLPAFGMDECAVSQFVWDGATKTEHDKLKFAFGFDAMSLQPQMVTFDARTLLPAHFEHLRARSAIVMPLTSGSQSLGVAVLPASVRQGSFYESLAELFGTILKVLELRRRAARSRPSRG